MKFWHSLEAHASQGLHAHGEEETDLCEDTAIAVETFLCEETVHAEEDEDDLEAIVDASS